MSAPIGHTCPDINGVIDDLKEATKSLDLIDNLSDNLSDNVYSALDNMASYVNEAKHIIDSQYSVLEKLREDNAKLRDWGERLQEEKDDTEKDLENAEYEITRLKDIINDKDFEISELENQK